MFKSKKEKLEEEILKEEMNDIDSSRKAEGENAGVEPKYEELPGDEKTSGEKDELSQEDRIAELETKVETLRDQLLRKAAEFENYKRRVEAEITGVYRFANENLLFELLPVLDDFDRVIKSAGENHDAETIKKGIDLVYEKFKLILEKQGVKEIESRGKLFDVNLHDALMQVENNELEPNTVLEVVEKGYYLKDKVLRHAKVVVSKKSEEE